MIRVIVAEDQALVLGALVALLEIETDITVVARARDGAEAVALTLDHRPDVLLTDIEMPHRSGLEVATELKRLGSTTRVVIVTTFGRAGYLRRALEAGAAGYLLKDSPPEVLADAVRRVHAGLRAVDPALAAQAWTAPDPLTDRERQALRLAADGMKSADIAIALGLSDGTVRNYLSDAMTKVGAGTRLEAARIARDNGWL
jgi:two-component system, NarL family, response regulator DesR